MTNTPNSVSWSAVTFSDVSRWDGQTELILGEIPSYQSTLNEIFDIEFDGHTIFALAIELIVDWCSPDLLETIIVP